MRLTEQEARAIRQSAREVFGDDVVVRLFGSRLDDDRRGGDIDLHVTLSSHDVPPVEARALFRTLLDRRVGEREYDIVVTTVGTPVSPVDGKALAEGRVL